MESNLDPVSTSLLGATCKDTKLPPEAFTLSIKSKIIFVTVDSTENCSFKLEIFSSVSPSILKPTEAYVLYGGPGFQFGFRAILA